MKPLIFALSATLAAAQVKPIRGFPEPQWQAQHQREAKLRGLAEAPRVETYIKRMTEKPHHAGSVGSREVADYALGLFKEWGLDAKIEVFEALLPFPTARTVEMTAPVRHQLSLAETVLSSDPDSGDADQLPTYNAYSATGDVTAPLVYVNYGIPEDYATLKKLGIDVKGKIVIARYGRSWRGTKAKVAQENGAVGCLIYSDPREDGYFQGDVYPKGPYRPEQGVQRGSVLDMPVQVGDPLSPGWASEPGGKRLELSQATTIMKIPVLPISYKEARPLLEQLGGPVAPEAWRGALPLTYHIGPGEATVHMKTDFDWTSKPMYNVVAEIRGSAYPDQWVIYGNHHDAWVNGASDPASGAAVVLETARALAELKKQGWQPLRTIKLILWDGEEFGLMGSTEWVEKHLPELKEKAVAYINSDSNGKGRLGVGGSPMVEEFMLEVARDNTDPATGKPIEFRGRGAGQPGLGPLGAGSDYVAFVHHAGIASFNAGFGGEGGGGTYHSIYDSFNWYKRFIDPDFRYGKALTSVMGTMLLRLADAPVVPFEYGRVASTVASYIEDIRKQKEMAAKLDFRKLEAELARLKNASAQYESALAAALKRGPAPSAAVGAANAVVYRAERSLTATEGLPGRPWYKHQLFAPGLYTGYGAKTLPGVREAAEGSRWEEAARQMETATRAIAALVEQVNTAARMLRSL